MNPKTIGAHHLSGEALPWVPFVPVSDRIEFKYFKIDPVRGDIYALMRVPPREGAHIHRHTGTVVVYTITGAWKYDQHKWISCAGDFVFETADSSHSFTGMSDEETLAFVIVQGELQFLDDKGNVAYVENWRRALDRYVTFCNAKGIGPRDLCNYNEN
jgi:2,4'-dihydroxyacetophenone dioxygenase